MFNFNSKGFPFHRGRRLRKTEAIRKAFSECDLSTNDLVMPYFIKEKGDKTEILNMPGIKRFDEEEILFEIEKVMKNGIRTIALFPKISEDKKKVDGIECLNDKNLICTVIKNVKKQFNDISIVGDIALDAYTSTGHDGVIDSSGYVDNDKTIKILSKMAVLLANCGCDIVAPSDMMDGTVKEIRNELEKSKNLNTCILSYSAKFASNLFSPFREALGSSKNIGKSPKDSYQLNFKNSREAIKKALEDIYEGADIIMVKPAMYYLDIINQLKTNTLVPIAAYQVSGEYSMIKVASEKNIINLKDTVLESLMGIKRSGADIIFSYFAKDVAEWLK